MNFKNKYLKYKKKYLELKGSGLGDIYDYTNKQKTYIEDGFIKDLNDSQFKSSVIKDIKKIDDLFFIKTQSNSIYILKNIEKPNTRLNKIIENNLKIYINLRIPFYDKITKELKDYYGGTKKILNTYEFNNIVIYKQNVNKWYIFDSLPMELGYNNFSRFTRLQIEFISSKTDNDDLKKLFNNKIGKIDINYKATDEEFNQLFQNIYDQLS